jgi:hypothetical protein
MVDMTLSSRHYQDLGAQRIYAGNRNLERKYSRIGGFEFQADRCRRSACREGIRQAAMADLGR